MYDLSRITCLGEALLDATVTYKRSTALVEADRNREKWRKTYAELRAEARSVAAALAAQGFAAGDRCAILMSNQSRWLISATGALWAGAILIPLDYKLTAPEQAALLRHGKPRVLVTEYSVWHKLQREPLPAGLTVYVSEAPDTWTPGPVGKAVGTTDDVTAARWEDALTAPTSETVYRPRQRADVACIVYSSGTGGVPKGCQLTHGNYLAQAEVLGQMYPMEEGERYFSLLPTNHAIDFMCGFLIPLTMGAMVVHQRTLRPQFIVDTLKRYEITHMALVPLILKALKDKVQEKLDELPEWKKQVVDALADVNERATKRRPNHGLSKTLLKPIHDSFGGSLKLMFCGGAFVDRDAAEFFYRLGLPVAIGYGLTEAGTVLTVNDLEPFRGDTVGRAVKGTEVVVRDPDAHGVGEVWVRGPTVMKGYLDAPELTAEAIVDGWLRTGDLGVFDAAGHLKLVGRSKNMIVTEGGKNIYPEDIEAGFEGVKGVEELCAFATNYIWRSGSLTGETLTLVVRPKDTGKGDVHGLSQALMDELVARNRRLADFKRIATVAVWDKEFPRTASMKIKRDPLARELAACDKASLLVDLAQ